MKSYLFSCVLLFLFVQQNVAQTLTGRVVDENNLPIEYANVMLLSIPDSAYCNGCVSDANGLFVFQLKEKRKYLLKASSIGYATSFRECEIGNIGDIVLNPDAVLLSETIVTATRQIHKLKNGSLVTDVANSPLKNESQVMDMLKKIPRITVSQGKLEVFGVGAPIVYINNRKVNSDEEIVMLDPKNIKEVELITNPGAKYDAEGKAVLKIITQNREEGWNTKLDLAFTQSRRLSNREEVAIDYKGKRLSISGFYAFDNSRAKTNQIFQNSIHAKEELWKYDNTLNTLFDSKQHDYIFHTEYAFNEKHLIGVQYSGSRAERNSNADEWQWVANNSAPYKEVMSVSDYQVPYNSNHLNTYYSGRLSEQFGLELNMDYVNSNTTQKQNVTESAIGEDVRNIIVKSKTKSEVYGAKLELNYDLGRGGTFLVGGEFSRVNINGSLANKPLVVPNAEFDNMENKFAGYIMYTLSLGQCSLDAGLRYESVKSDIKDIIDPAGTINKRYKDWFPNVSLTLPIGKVQSAFSYSVRTTRPAFEFLNSKTYYSNQFQMQVGNPELVPQQIQNVQMDFNYSIFNLGVAYKHIKDYISSVLYSQGNVIINSWKNYNKYDAFSANLSINKTFSCWSTMLAGSVTMPFFKLEYMNEKYSNDTPQFYIQSVNYILLPKGFQLSGDFFYTNGGSSGIYDAKPFYALNLGVQKSFFNEKLKISLQGNDILGTQVYKYKAAIGNVNYYQREDQDQRNIMLNVTYRLNNKKNSYRGKSAVQNEINRL